MDVDEHRSPVKAKKTKGASKEEENKKQQEHQEEDKVQEDGQDAMQEGVKQEGDAAAGEGAEGGKKRRAAKGNKDYKDSGIAVRFRTRRGGMTACVLAGLILLCRAPQHITQSCCPALQTTPSIMDHHARLGAMWTHVQVRASKNDMVIVKEETECPSEAAALEETGGNAGSARRRCVHSCSANIQV